jgi:chromosome segregation ATPase
MCNHIKANGEKCKLAPKKSYCHIHKITFSNVIIQKDSSNNLKKEIVNLNKTIERKVNKIKELNENLEFFKQEVNELNNKINLMNENCEKYELIQKYTYLKNELIKINRKTTPYKILSNPYYKNIIETKFNKPQDILLEEFTNLRNHRNSYCH